MKKTYPVIVLILFVAQINLSAQHDTLIVESSISNLQRIDTKNDTLLQIPSDKVWERCTSLFMELGGKGWLSLNLDFRIKETFAISFGAVMEEGVAPNAMAYYFGGKRHRIEMGGGVTGFVVDGDLIGMMVNGVIGYRYQKKRGLLFRGGFTPMFAIPFTDEGTYAIIPWAGVSLGYSF